MSYVLDALKRSEQDRKQGQVPSFNDQGALLHLSKAERPLWPVVLIVVLALNAAVFLYLHWSEKSEAVLPSEAATNSATSKNIYRAEDEHAIDDSRADTAQTHQPDGSQATGLASAALLGPAPEMPANPVSVRPAVSAVGQLETEAQALQQKDQIDWAAREREAKRLIEASVAHGSDGESVQTQALRIDPRQSPEAQAPDTRSYEVIKPKAVPVGGALPFPAVTSTSQDSSGVVEPVPETDYSQVQFLYEMDARQQPRVPKLKFNSHIYSDQPDARRVMINNIYLREGQSLSGLDVVQIGEANIVFRKGNTLFKLPAMRDWEG